MYKRQVLAKDALTPVQAEEVRAMIKKSLERAALVNYERLAAEARVDGKCIQENVASCQLKSPVPPHLKELLYNVVEPLESL